MRVSMHSSRWKVRSSRHGHHAPADANAPPVLGGLRRPGGPLQGGPGANKRNASKMAMLEMIVEGTLRPIITISGSSRYGWIRVGSENGLNSFRNLLRTHFRTCCSALGNGCRSIDIKVLDRPAQARAPRIISDTRFDRASADPP